jgi:hypothetical protein
MGRRDKCEALHADTPCLPGDPGQGLPILHVQERRRMQGVPMTLNRLREPI